jgi:protein gp37
MSDLFHEAVPASSSPLSGAMQATPQHTYQILTKRPDRWRDHRIAAGAPNVWLGTSVESADYLGALTICKVNAAVRFIRSSRYWVRGSAD